MANLTINGRQVSVDDGFLNLPREEQEAAVEEIAKSLTSENKTPSGTAAGIVHGGAELARGIASTAKRFGGVGDGGAQLEDPNYVPANVTNGSWNPANWSLSQLPQKVAEMAPSVVPDVASATVGAKLGKRIGPKSALIGGLIGAMGSGWLRTAGDTAKEAAVARTGDDTAEPDSSDLTRGGLTAAASAGAGALLPTRLVPGMNKLGTVGTQGALDAVKRYLGTTAIGGAGAVASDATKQAGLSVGTDKGLSVDPSNFPEDFVGGAATAGVMAAPKMAAEAASAANNRQFGGDNVEATKNYATRLSNTGVDLGNATRDATAHETVKTDLKNELRDAANKVRQTGALGPDADNVLQRAQDGKPLSAKDVQDIEAATAHHPDGANAAYLARTLHVAQLAEGKGSYSGNLWAGGISGALDKNLGYMLNPTRILGGGIASLAGMHLLGLSNPLFAGSVAGGYGAARVIDSMTGMRSPAKTFAEHFADRNAQLRLPSTPQAPPPAAAPPPANAPWGPRPPMAGPTGPTVQLPATPQAPQGPWGARPLPTTSVPAVAQAAPPAPPGPAINPMALSMLKQTLKQGLPAEPQPEAPQAPTFNPMALSMLQQKLKADAATKATEPVKQAQAEKAAAAVAQAQAKAEQKQQTEAQRAQAKAEAARVRAEKAEAAVVKAKDKEAAKVELAKAKAAAAQAKEASRLEMAKVKAAASMLKQASVKPAPAKITKSNGKFNATADEAPAPFEPLMEHQLYPKGITAKQYADLESSEYGAGSPTYRLKAELTGQKRIDAANELTGRFPEYSHAINGLLRQLHRLGRNPADVASAVNHYASHIKDAEAAKAVREAFK